MIRVSDLLKKYREILVYLVFGVLTTCVSWAVYYAILLGGRALLGLPAEDTASAQYLVLYSVAQVLQWVAGVLFAFFTNRKWVFTDADRSVSLFRQLVTFSGSRVVTFFLDYGITLGGTYALSALFPAWTACDFLGKERNLVELLSKLVAAVIVVVCNYLISKLFVFRSRKRD